MTVVKIVGSIFLQLAALLFAFTAGNMLAHQNEAVLTAVMWAVGAAGWSLSLIGEAVYERRKRNGA